jgi:hypothetical protein
MIDSEPTNEIRCYWTTATLEFYAKTKDEVFKPDEYPEAAAETMRDLLADLMHFSERFGIDFDEQLSLATDHYGFERLEADASVCP